MVAVRLENVTKTFGAVMAVDAVSLDVPEGELFFLLGPSGCGKTTILRTVAGFEAPDSGRVFFDGRDVTRLAPHRRNTGMVFQNYALWPHMTVFENVAYGLRVRGLDSPEITKRVAAALEMVRMSAESLRYPNQLSGGQQQRVALARALVINPGCLLLDEPLSNLDAKLRLEMRAEIKRIHEASRVTTVYVTHDQKEALSMAQRLAVLKDGRVVQVGRPGEIYRLPADAFVAAFIGEANLIEGTLARVDGAGVSVDTDVGRIAGVLQNFPGARPGDKCIVSVRPEDILPAASPGRDNSVGAEVVQYSFLGEVGQYLFRSGSRGFKVLVVAPAAAPEGQAAYLTFPASRVLVFPYTGPVAEV